MQNVLIRDTSEKAANSGIHEQKLPNSEHGVGCFPQADDSYPDEMSWSGEKTLLLGKTFRLHFAGSS